MRKFFYLLATVALVAFASCTKEVNTSEFNGGSEGLAKFTIAAPTAATRAAYDENNIALTDMRLNFAIAYDGEIFYSEEREWADASQAETFNVALVAGKDYSVLVWADHGADYYTVDLTSGTVDMASLEVAGSDPLYDAYYAKDEFNFSPASDARAIVLTRPFGLVRIAAEDCDEPAIQAAGLCPTEYAIAEISVPTQLDLLTGIAGEEATVSIAGNIAEEECTAGSREMSFDFFFANAEQGNLADFTAEYTASSAPVASYTFQNIPLRRNFITYIHGNILTQTGEITVSVDATWNEDEPAGPIEAFDSVAVAKVNYATSELLVDIAVSDEYVEGYFAYPVTKYAYETMCEGDAQKCAEMFGKSFATIEAGDVRILAGSQTGFNLAFIWPNNLQENGTYRVIVFGIDEEGVPTTNVVLSDEFVYDTEAPAGPVEAFNSVEVTRVNFATEEIIANIEVADSFTDKYIAYPVSKSLYDGMGGGDADQCAEKLLASFKTLGDSFKISGSQTDYNVASVWPSTAFTEGGTYRVLLVALNADGELAAKSIASEEFVYETEAPAGPVEAFLSVEVTKVNFATEEILANIEVADSFTDKYLAYPVAKSLFDGMGEGDADKCAEALIASFKTLGDSYKIAGSQTDYNVASVWPSTAFTEGSTYRVLLVALNAEGELIAKSVASEEFVYETEAPAGPVEAFNSVTVTKANYATAEILATIDVEDTFTSSYFAYPVGANDFENNYASDADAYAASNASMFKMYNFDGSSVLLNGSQTDVNLNNVWRSANFAEGDYYVVMFALDADGAVITKALASEKFTYGAEAVTPSNPTLDVTVIPSIKSAKFDFEMSADVATFYYYNIEYTSYMMTDESAEANIRAVLEGERSYITPPTPTDGKYSVETSYLKANTKYRFVAMGRTSDGTYTELYAEDYKTLDYSYDSDASVAVTSSAWGVFGTYGAHALTVEFARDNGAESCAYGIINISSLGTDPTPQECATYLFSSGSTATTTENVVAPSSYGSQDQTAVILIPIDAEGNYGTPVIARASDATAE